MRRGRVWGRGEGIKELERRRRDGREGAAPIYQTAKDYLAAYTSIKKEADALCGKGGAHQNIFNPKIYRTGKRTGSLDILRAYV